MPAICDGVMVLVLILGTCDLNVMFFVTLTYVKWKVLFVKVLNVITVLLINFLLNFVRVICPGTYLIHN